MALITWAACMSGAGDLARARKEYERAVELGPRYVAAKLRLGQVQLELGDLEAAEESFRAALALAPASAGAFQGLGRIAQERQQYDLAIGALPEGSRAPAGSRVDPSRAGDGVSTAGRCGAGPRAPEPLRGPGPCSSRIR